MITVPNSRFISAHVDNWGARRYRRIKTMVSLTYDTPPLKIEAFCEAVRELIRKHPYTRKDYYHVYLNALGAASLDVLLYCFVQTPDWSTELREKHRLYLDILRVAEGLGIEIAFPTQTIHVAKDKEGEEGGWKECTIINISRNGLGITFFIQENLKAGSSVQIETFPPGQMEPLMVEGEVRWFETLSSGGFICGIKLTEKLNQDKFEGLIPDASGKKT